METVFWISAAFVFYTYAGYPFLMALRAWLSPCPVRRGRFLPQISVVIAACNEEAGIGRRLENLLSQDYPRDWYEIIVVSDGSSDNTNRIVKSFFDRNVQLVSLPQRMGKAVALNHGVARAEGEIIVFADARQVFGDDALTRLAANFCDPVVGCVSGELMLLEEAGGGIGVEMGAYWRYEKLVRQMEASTGSVVGATGAIYAIRRTLYIPLPAGTILDDVLVPMNVARQGYRVTFDSAPKAYDRVSKGMDQEWVRKVRTLAGNLQLLQISPSLAVPWMSPLWWRFLSHKIFRLFVPFALCCLIIASFGADGFCYRIALFAQVVFYLIALAGGLVPSLRKMGLVKLTVFFTVMNMAAVAGFWMWASGRCSKSWRPAYGK